jgi:hypothetical protein
VREALSRYRTTREHAEKGPVPAKVDLGFVVATPTAFAKLTQADVTIPMNRRIQGGSGDPDEHDWLGNEKVLKRRGCLFSTYNAVDGTRFRIIAKHDCPTATSPLNPRLSPRVRAWLFW